jgi:hypothetical protein
MRSVSCCPEFGPEVGWGGNQKTPFRRAERGFFPVRSTVPALGSSRKFPDSDVLDLLDLPDQPDRLNGELGTHGTSTINKCQTPPRHARRGFVGEGVVGPGCGPGWDSDCGPGYGSGGPRQAWFGRLKIGAHGKPAFRAPDSEPR